MYYHNCHHKNKVIFLKKGIELVFQKMFKNSNEIDVLKNIQRLSPFYMNSMEIYDFNNCDDSKYYILAIFYLKVIKTLNISQISIKYFLFYSYLTIK